MYLPLSLPACIKKPFINMTVLMESYFIIVLLLKINWFNNMNWYWHQKKLLYYIRSLKRIRLDLVLGRHPAPPGARFLPHAGQSSNLGPNTELLACCSSPRTYPAPYWSQTFREHWNQIFSIKNQELSDSHLAHQPVELQHALEDGPHQICAPLFKLSVCTTHFLTLEASLIGAHL